MYVQDQYEILTEWCTMNEYNPALAEASIRCFKYNRTYTALNLTLSLTRTINVLTGKVYSKILLSNTYREFPLSFGRNLCDMMKNNEFGFGNIFSCGNFTTCPLKTGSYRMCNWGPDYTKYPPNLVKGRFQMDLVFFGDGAFIMNASWFFKLTYKNPALN
ncbi:uncharacterized protein LOC116180671 [Photinus pyralis]|uniref:uncharacterized protein LOC116180671 n=1 Tax=Photinus pyralis TaxID=7054 RepID=UPI00126741EA|nr:uncharacterized protein LOC116180671 [Photinus pyralis]